MSSPEKALDDVRFSRVLAVMLVRGSHREHDTIDVLGHSGEVPPDTGRMVTAGHRRDLVRAFIFRYLVDVRDELPGILGSLFEVYGIVLVSSYVASSLMPQASTPSSRHRRRRRHRPRRRPHPSSGGGSPRYRSRSGCGAVRAVPHHGPGAGVCHCLHEG